MSEYIPSSVCRIGKISCMGCCGHDFESRKDIEEGIRKNSIRLKNSKTKEKFMYKGKFIRESGICYNVVFFDDETVGCPLHPKQNEGKDFREGYCEIEHLCKAAYMFSKWDEKRKKQFIDFILEKRLDWYEFSVRMDNDSFLKEFEEKFGSE